MINTIGPVWDGNEVWVLVAGGATFAAFPEWYATLFSGFYLPLLLILRRADRARRRVRVPRQARRRGVAGPLGRRASSSAPTCRRCCGVSPSPTSCAGCRSTRTRSTPAAFFNLLNPYALLGGADHAAALPHPRRGLHRAEDRRPDPAPGPRPGDAARARSPPCVAVVSWSGPRSTPAASPRRWCSCWLRVAFVAGLLAVPAGREGWAFIGTFVAIALAVAALFLALFPDVMPSLYRPGVQPDHHQRVRDRLHAEDHDHRGAHLHAARAALPGLDLLGVPQADLVTTSRRRRAERASNPAAPR